MLPATRGVSKMPGAMVMTRLLLVCTAAFALIWVVASLSTSPEMLIAARALLGIADRMDYAIDPDAVDAGADPRHVRRCGNS